MKLDNRLAAIAELVPAGCRLADIGSDHAYLPCTLVKAGKAAHAIASDKNEGPYEAAKRTIQEEDLIGRVEARLGDGLASIKPGEVDVISISGMGGKLMQEILMNHPKVLSSVGTAILQPQNAAEELRGWIYDQGWHIDEEALAIEDDRLYTILRAVRGKRDKPSPILLAVGPRLWERKPPLLRAHMEQLIFSCRRILTGMEGSEAARESARYQEVQQRMKELEAHLTW